MLVNRKRSESFAILTFTKEKRSTFKKYYPQSILTKYSKRLTVQQLSKHCKVKLDLDGLKNARYPRITKRETKQLSVLSLWCNQRLETFVILAFFKQQLTNNRSKVCVLLWLFRAFYSLSFSSYIYKVRDTHSEKPLRRFLFTT